MAGHPAAASLHPAGATVLLGEEEAPPSSFVPIRINESITMRELAEDYCISSVLECDATGCVPPRAVALDSPLDILHGGKYYIARRDMPRLGRSPRVTFRGKIVVEEFDLDHALVNREEENGQLSHSASAPAAAAAAATAAVDTRSAVLAVAPAPRRSEGRKRCIRDVEEEEMEEEEEDLYKDMSSMSYTFVPYVGDLYGDGCEALIQFDDVKRLCENVEGDEAEFHARHAQAESILAEARELLLALGTPREGCVDGTP